MNKLFPFYIHIILLFLPDDLRQGIRELSSEVRDYRELTAKKQAMLEGNAKYQARANTLTEEIRRILLSYNALDQTLPYNSCLAKSSETV